MMNKISLNNRMLSAMCTVTKLIVTVHIFIALNITSLIGGTDTFGWQEFAVSQSSDDQENPDIDGNIVVWQEYVSEFGDYDIIIANIKEPESIISTYIGDDSDQINPAVYDKYVVWQHYTSEQMTGDWDILLADVTDLGDLEVYYVSGIIGHDEVAPDIHGNIVVWQEINGKDWSIFGADITNPDIPVEFTVSDFVFDQQKPGIYRNTVVWQDNYFGDEDVISADIWLRNKPKETILAGYLANQSNPAIWGDIVVYQDEFYLDGDIYAARLFDDGRVIEFAVSATEASEINPAVSDNIILWQDDRNGNWDIYGYNITTGQRFQVTSDPADQINPAISGNTAVWQDNRNGPWNIYAVFLDGPESAYCEYKLDGDITGDCKVDMSDFAIMASQWLWSNLYYDLFYEL